MCATLEPVVNVNVCELFVSTSGEHEGKEEREGERERESKTHYCVKPCPFIYSHSAIRHIEWRARAIKSMRSLTRERERERRLPTCWFSWRKWWIVHMHTIIWRRCTFCVESEREREGDFCRKRQFYCLSVLKETLVTNSIHRQVYFFNLFKVLSFICALFQTKAIECHSCRLLVCACVWERERERVSSRCFFVHINRQWVFPFLLPFLFSQYTLPATMNTHELTRNTQARTQTVYLLSRSPPRFPETMGGDERIKCVTFNRPQGLSIIDCSSTLSHKTQSKETGRTKQTERPINRVIF